MRWGWIALTCAAISVAAWLRYLTAEPRPAWVLAIGTFASLATVLAWEVDTTLAITNRRSDKDE